MCAHYTNRFSQQRSAFQTQPFSLGLGRLLSCVVLCCLWHLITNLRTLLICRYDLMAGVTRAEAFFSFNSGDVQYGIEADRRSRILKAYVRNTYTFHLNEIFATIVNEYTDWERPVQHPINIRWVIAFVVRPYGPRAHGSDCYIPPTVGSPAEAEACAAPDACYPQQVSQAGAARYGTFASNKYFVLN